MKISKLYIYIMIIALLILNQIFANTPLKVVKKDYSQSFKQARSLEKNALFDEAEIIYKEGLHQEKATHIQKEINEIIKKIGKLVQEKK